MLYVIFTAQQLELGHLEGPVESIGQEVRTGAFRTVHAAGRRWEVGSARSSSTSVARALSGIGS